MLTNTSGFLYYVSITGITGAGMGGPDAIRQAKELIATKSDLPVAVGFGIKTRDDVAAMAEVADAVVVGSALVEHINATAGAARRIDAAGLESVLGFARELASGVR